LKPSAYIRLFGFISSIGLIVSGCLLKPVTVSTRRFVLEPVSPSENAATSAERLSVGIAPVRMPPYLIRTSMIVRRGATEIDYLDDALWAERLDQCFQRTLAVNLATILPSDRVYLSAWDRDQVMVRVAVNVQQFDVDMQGQGTLVASWRITAPGTDKPLKSGQSRLTHTDPAVAHVNPQVIAATLSALTTEFSRELAQAIHQVTDGIARNSSQWEVVK
jgi:uncharacterized lipoprotein YmbA